MSNSTKQTLLKMYELEGKRKKKVKVTPTTMDEREFEKCMELLKNN